MKKKREFFVFSTLAIFVTFILSFFFEIKLILIFLLSFILLFSYILYKERVGQELIVALLFSICLTSYYLYNYTSYNLFIGKINLFPLISWTFGLVLLREIYEKIKFKHKFIFASLFYIFTLFLVEYVGFYLLNIRLTSSYPSLFNLGIIHAPLGMKFFYVLAGPVYLLVTDYLKLKYV